MFFTIICSTFIISRQYYCGFKSFDKLGTRTSKTKISLWEEFIIFHSGFIQMNVKCNQWYNVIFVKGFTLYLQYSSSVLIIKLYILIRYITHSKWICRQHRSRLTRVMVEVWTAEINEMLEILERSCWCEVNDAGPEIFLFNCFNIFTLNIS